MFVCLSASLFLTTTESIEFYILGKLYIYQGMVYDISFSGLSCLLVVDSFIWPTSFTLYKQPLEAGSTATSYIEY